MIAKLTPGSGEAAPMAAGIIMQSTVQLAAEPAAMRSSLGDP